MKKALLIIVVLLIILGAVFALAFRGGGDHDGTTESATDGAQVTDPFIEESTSEAAAQNADNSQGVEETTEPEDTFVPVIGENLQKYVVEPLNSDRYTITTGTDGFKIKTVKSGDNSAIVLDISLDLKMIGASLPAASIKFIIKNGQTFMVNTTRRRFSEITPKELEETADAFNVSDELKYDNVVLKSTDTVNQDGKEYIVETYDTKEGTVERYYFYNDSLAYYEVEEKVDGEAKATKIELEISPNADEGIFDIPRTYKEVPFKDLLSDFSGLFSGLS